MKLTKKRINDASSYFLQISEIRIPAADCARVALESIEANERVATLLTNLATDIASMRECDRKRTMKSIAVELRRALYGEE